jgi:hypothetical protein
LEEVDDEYGNNRAQRIRANSPQSPLSLNCRRRSRKRTAMIANLTINPRKSRRLFSAARRQKDLQHVKDNRIRSRLQ